MKFTELKNLTSILWFSNWWRSEGNFELYTFSLFSVQVKHKVPVCTWDFLRQVISFGNKRFLSLAQKLINILLPKFTSKVYISIPSLDCLSLGALDSLAFIELSKLICSQFLCLGVYLIWSIPRSSPAATVSIEISPSSRPSHVWPVSQCCPAYHCWA